MTLLFAGHDTTTSTVAFMFYELARNPELARRPGINVEMILDETLRKYPPAYIGPRRAVEPFEFNGAPVPGERARPVLLVGEPPPAGRVARAGGVRPDRFTEENKAKLPRGAYVPFGGGSRTCIGMRFGQAEIAIIARAILERFRLELVPGYELRDPPRADDLAARRGCRCASGRGAGGGAGQRPGCFAEQLRARSGTSRTAERPRPWAQAAGHAWLRRAPRRLPASDRRAFDREDQTSMLRS